MRIQNQKGAALLAALVVMSLLMALVGAMAVNTTSDTRLRGIFGQNVSNFYAAEAGLNVGMAEFRNIFLNYNVPQSSDLTPRTITLNGRTVSYQMKEVPGNPKKITVPAGEQFAGANSFQYTYEVVSSAEATNAISQSEIGGQFLIDYIPIFQFFGFYAGDLELSPGPPMTITGRLHTNEDLYLDGKLEIKDDPAQGVNSVTVTAAGSVYRGTKPINGCRTADYVRIDKLEDVVAPSGDLDPLDLPCNANATRLVPQTELDNWLGTVKSGVSTVSMPAPDIVERGTGTFWQSADLRIVLKLGTPDSLPGGVVLPHTIEVQNADGSRDVAKTTALHAFMSDGAWNDSAGGPYHGTMPIFYSDVPFGSAAACGACADNNPGCGGHNNPACYTFDTAPALPARNGSAYAQVMGTNFNGTGTGTFDLDYRRGGYYNWREEKWITMLNVNIGDMLRWNPQNLSPLFDNADTSTGGLVIFLSVEGPISDGINNYGVRVFGGANLAIPGGIGASADPTGITIVSDQAMYVLGDYNRGTVPSSWINPWSDQTNNLPQQPASFIGDSLTILSEGYWRPEASCTTFCRDRQSVELLTDASRQATQTTINAAFIAGVDETPDGYPGWGSYSGGLHNYPRFQEDWNIPLTPLHLRTSFVSLGPSKHVDGPWCLNTGTGCNSYYPPQRLWEYEAANEVLENLPPMTPRVVHIKQLLFTQEFR